MADKVALPVHIGFIMDGNGRWAVKRGLPRKAGHSAGAKSMENIIKYCHKIGIRNITFYAFSTENWSRPEDEVKEIMRLLGNYLDRLITDIKTGNADSYKDSRMIFIGKKDGIFQELKDKISEIERLTDGDDRKMTVYIAFNYGGRSEIVESVNKFISKYHGKLITEADITAGLFSAPAPDPDLIIRTAGEMRLSNFLIWQAAYSEFYSTSVCWPDFTPSELDKALEEYGKRTRRFGGLTSQ